MTRQGIILTVAIVLSLSIGTWHLGSAVWIFGKAYVATFLIDDAWQHTKESRAVSKPWSWADTWPVARIEIPAVSMNEIVLSGDSGATLAFGPGLSNTGTALDGEGVKLISGHRDTHFNKLKNVSINDEIHIETINGDSRYKVVDMQVVDSRYYTLNPVAGDELVLSTCYPFNSLKYGGYERYIVRAQKMANNISREEIKEGESGLPRMSFM